ncbi:MAG: polysaccharide deacetylase family protein [Pseudomonadota bacterium]
MSDIPYPRDLIGYGPTPPHAGWPDGARLCLSIVISYEEGGETSVLHGDDRSETVLAEVAGLAPVIGARDVNTESIYEYGSRAGYWRLLRVLHARRMRATVYAVTMALERHPGVARAAMQAGFELVAHGHRWIDYANVPEADERADIATAIDVIRRLTGHRPVGWYTGRPSVNTRRLLVEEGGFRYDSDSYADDLPYWDRSLGRPHLVIPHQFDTNDSKLVHTNGFPNGGAWEAYLRDSFDMLYAEGAEYPRMMTVSLHPRIAGRPGRALAFARFLDYVAAHPHVWVATRKEIAEHWIATHPPQDLDVSPT